MKKTNNVQELQAIAKQIRREIVEMITHAKSGHPGGSLSEIDMLVALYFGGALDYRANEPEWPERDRFCLSKGHASPGYYSTLARAGASAHGIIGVRYDATEIAPGVTEVLCYGTAVKLER